MTKLRIVCSSIALAALLAVGCKNEAVEATEAMANEICACKDQACIEAASKKHMEKLAKLAETKVTKSDEEKIEGHTKRMMECISKVGMGGTEEK